MTFIIDCALSTELVRQKGFLLMLNYSQKGWFNHLLNALSKMPEQIFQAKSNAKCSKFVFPIESIFWVPDNCKVGFS